MMDAYVECQLGQLRIWVGTMQADDGSAGCSVEPDHGRIAGLPDDRALRARIGDALLSRRDPPRRRRLIGARARARTATPPW